MKVFLDTSALAPVFLAQHPGHQASLRLFKSLTPQTGLAAVPCLGELYGMLTSAPERSAVAPRLAREIIQTIAQRLSVVPVSAGDYLAAVNYCVAHSLSGLVVQDAAVARCALTARAGIFYTWEPEVFQVFGDDACPPIRQPGA